MSEELLQVVSTKIGRFEYWPTRASNLDQLLKAKIITDAVQKKLSKKKPDGIIVAPGGQVVAVIEYKDPKALKTPAQVKKAIEQEIEVARSLCNLLIVTDNQKTLWVNAHTGKQISDSGGALLTEILNVKHLQDGTLKQEGIESLERLIDSISESITAKNNKIAPLALLDPTPLANSLWQRIWISTGKEPEKCLYNVVELFVFKFLSDLKVLKKHKNFASVYEIRKTSAEDALKQYAAISRDEIRKLFPPGDDGTTLINGTIFVNEDGKANLAQASLFGDVLDQLEQFERRNGSFRHIDREFKTRLYESFLRQSAGVKALGQYFTPRNVVKAMVKMSSAASLPKDARICDPYCGVGGFLLETIAEVPSIFKQFEPRGGKVAPTITLVGYDKGSDEKDDERTIILAKANMLIYFSELIAKHNSAAVLKEFSSNAFNKVFRLLRSNLGSFAQNSDTPYDLMLTNPPYVTSGVGTLRRAIDDAGLSSYYTCQGRGTEALAIEWVIRNLAPGGQALVVVPDGLLAQKGVVQFIAERCIVQGVISLPTRTFYSTPKKTYILIFTKKKEGDGVQTTPVLAYLASEIGESRDAYRFPTPEKNDLIEATNLFNQFKGSPSSFATTAPRCKTKAGADFLKMTDWVVDRWWTDDEKRSLGISETATEMSGDEFVALAKDVKAAIDGLAVKALGKPKKKVKETALFLGGDWMEYIQQKTFWTKTEYRKLETADPDRIPVYSAAKDPVAHVKPIHEKRILASATEPVISFAANGDGSAGTNFVFHTSPFYVSNDRTCIKVKNPLIDPEYVLFALHGMREAHGFNHARKAVKENLGVVSISIPTSQGKFDLKAQQDKVKSFKEIYEAKKTLEAQLDSLVNGRLLFG